ncbi:hypothetical protein [Bacillus sp. V3-13]|uniref:hypothetical protein n=1 Tax=Bacillus sp. V3-13 TaxID=2053728 RepID=UPI0015E09F91|nr:hypothetical protein [Bacillus sp. V3-13]
MFTKLVPNDADIEQGSSFASDEVPYNLVYRICESNKSLSIKLQNGKIVGLKIA